MLVLRRAIIDDIEDTLEVAEGWAAEYLIPLGLGWSRESLGNALKRSISEEERVLFVADEEGTIIGWILGYLGGSVFDSEEVRAICVAWFVKKENRGGKAAIRLLRAFEQWSEGMGATKIITSSLQSNQPELMDKLYTKLNYKKLESLFVRSI